MTKPNKQNSGISFDSLGVKLSYAEHHLSKITSTIPDRLTNNNNFLVLEYHIESFLFFLTSVQDILFREINKKLNFNIKEYNVSLDKIIEKLKISKSLIAVKILPEFEKYFSAPKKRIKILSKKDVEKENLLVNYKEEQNGWLIRNKTDLDIGGIVHDKNGIRKISFSRKNCTLWEIRELRNHAAHGSTLDIDIYVICLTEHISKLI